MQFETDSVTDMLNMLNFKIKTLASVAVGDNVIHSRELFHPSDEGSYCTFYITEASDNINLRTCLG